jgi:hypothetical protein
VESPDKHGSSGPTFATTGRGVPKEDAMKLPFMRQKTELDPLQVALDLRARYGEAAEEWCETGILSADRLAERRDLYLVREALRLVSTEDMALA